MDPIRLNTLVNALRTTPSRRATLGALLFLVTKLPSIAGTEASKHKRKDRKQCKPPCPACKRCVKGTCKQKAATDLCRPARCGTGGACHVFVTATRYGANLGGLNGADAVCQAEAMTAGLPGV